MALTRCCDSFEVGAVKIEVTPTVIFWFKFLHLACSNKIHNNQAQDRIFQ